MNVHIHIRRTRDFDAATTPQEKIERIMRLYERPGTPGEKAAAYAALMRMGVNPNQNTFSFTPKPKEFVRPPSGPKTYEVTITINGSIFRVYSVVASDEIDAEEKARKLARKDYGVGFNRQNPYASAKRKM